MWTLDYYPSSPARFKRYRTVTVKKFPPFKNLNKPRYIDIDFLWQLLDPSGPPQRAEPLPFQHITFFYYPYYALPEASQFYLRSTYPFNTCAQVISVWWELCFLLWVDGSTYRTRLVLNIHFVNAPLKGPKIFHCALWVSVSFCTRWTLLLFSHCFVQINTYNAEECPGCHICVCYADWHNLLYSCR